MKQNMTLRRLMKSYCKKVRLAAVGKFVLIVGNKKYGLEQTVNEFEGATVLVKQDEDLLESSRTSEQTNRSSNIMSRSRTKMLEVSQAEKEGQPDVDPSEATRFNNELELERSGFNCACSSKLINKPFCPICSKQFLNVPRHMKRVHKEASLWRQEEASNAVVDTTSEAVPDRVKFVIHTDLFNVAGEAIEDIDCAMKHTTTVKQLMKSYCKWVGLESGKVSLAIGKRTLGKRQTVKKFAGERVVVGLK